MKAVTTWFKRISSPEHRKAQRMKSPLLVAYYWDGAAPKSHTIQNISSNGFYLVTKERWLPGTMVTMTLQRTDMAHEKTGREEGFDQICGASQVGSGPRNHRVH